MRRCLALVAAVGLLVAVASTSTVAAKSEGDHQIRASIEMGYPSVAVRSTVSLDHGKLLSTLEFQNLLTAKMERQLDILSIGHPGVEKHLNTVISMLRNELGK